MMDRRKLRERHEFNLAQWAKHGPAIIKAMSHIERLEAVHNNAVKQEAAK